MNIVTKNPRDAGYPKLLRYEAPKRPPRVVPAFTIQALQKNVIVQEPPKCGVFNVNLPKKTSTFNLYYTRGDLPLYLIVDKEYKLVWTCDIKSLDYHYYLPLFFDGLCETDRTLKRIAELGIADMLSQGGKKILPVVPQLILPIKRALNTRCEDIIISTLKSLQNLAMASEMIGQALVPYYRQLLPIVNLFKDKEDPNQDLDSEKDKEETLGRVIEQTLNILEETGGEDAYINIKYMVPTYESCIMN